MEEVKKEEEVSKEEVKEDPIIDSIFQESLKNWSIDLLSKISRLHII